MIGIGITNSSVKADAPITLDIAYHKEEQYVSVWFTHGVTDPSYHYVSLVTIEVNETLVRTETYTSQPTHNVWNYKYYGIVAFVANDSDDNLVNAANSADIRVNATCILGGTISEHAEAGWRHTHWKIGFTALIEPTVVFTLLVAVLLLVVPYLGRKKAGIAVADKKPVMRLLILIGLMLTIELLFIFVIGGPFKPGTLRYVPPADRIPPYFPFPPPWL